MAWARNGTPDTLSSSASTMSISDLTAKKFNVILSHQQGVANTVGNITINFNSDTGSNYANRRSTNGGADLTNTSLTYGYFHDDAGNDTFGSFHIAYLSNITTEEKLCIVFTIQNTGSGSGSTPSRSEHVLKWANTANQVTSIDLDGTGAGSFDTDSNLSAIGTD